MEAQGGSAREGVDDAAGGCCVVEAFPSGLVGAVGGVAEGHGYKELGTSGRSIGLSVRLQARPCSSWADATDHCFGAAAAKPCPLRRGAGLSQCRHVVAAADGRLLQRPQRPRLYYGKGWFGGLLLLPVSGRGGRHNVGRPGHVSASDGARMPSIDSCCATEGAQGSRRRSRSKLVTVHPSAPFHLSACFVPGDGWWAFPCNPWRACPITAEGKRGLREGQLLFFPLQAAQYYRTSLVLLQQAMRRQQLG
jgi:hypothetical protein